MINSKKEM